MHKVYKGCTAQDMVFDAKELLTKSNLRGNEHFCFSRKIFVCKNGASMLKAVCINVTYLNVVLLFCYKKLKKVQFSI
jgi:hypothetical protein